MSTALNLRYGDFDYWSDTDNGEFSELYGQLHQMIDQSVQYWRNDGVLRRSSLGHFAIGAKLMRGESALTDLRGRLDDPTSLVDYLYLPGGDIGDPPAAKYVANVVRKLLPTVRTGMNTDTLVRLRPELFVDPIKKGDDTADEWPYRDFPYAGGVLLDNGQSGDQKVWVLVGVSGFGQEEEHWLAKSVIGDFILLKLAGDSA